jgi:nucleoside phosphorylase
MKILIIEDNLQKLEVIKSELKKIIENIHIDTCNNFTCFVAEINRKKYDLVIADLLVPRFKDAKQPEDISRDLIAAIRDIACENFNTPVLAVTQFNILAEENFGDLNKYDISVITYDENSHDWVSSLSRKVTSCAPRPRYDFVIICALDKEANAYLDAGYEVGQAHQIDGMKCRDINVENWKGLIVTPPRMGLVNAAITSARVIDSFKPKLICMSGICAGIEEKANIYDVVIPDICHQHDSGKWTNDGFVPEIYSIQLQHATKLRISEILDQVDFREAIMNQIVASQDELPTGVTHLQFDVYMAPTSSGSAVVASDALLKDIKDQHRKMTAFEMESYAIYESARQSLSSPVYFSAKSVVDNGNSQKSDHFHRVACLVSARTVYELIRRGIIQQAR